MTARQATSLSGVWQQPTPPSAIMISGDTKSDPTRDSLSVGVSTLTAYLIGASAAGYNVDETLEQGRVAASASGRDRLDRIPTRQWARLVAQLQVTLNDEA